MEHDDLKHDLFFLIAKLMVISARISSNQQVDQSCFKLMMSTFLLWIKSQLKISGWTFVDLPPKHGATWLQVKPPEVDFGNSSNRIIEWAKAEGKLRNGLVCIYIYVYLQIAHRVLYPHAALQHLCTPIHAVVYIDIILYKPKLRIYIYTVTHIIIQYDTHIELQYTPFFGDASHHGFLRVKNPPSLQGCYLLLSVTALAMAMSPWFTCHGTHGTHGKTCWQRHNIG